MHGLRRRFRVTFAQRGHDGQMVFVGLAADGSYLGGPAPTFEQQVGNALVKAQVNRVARRLDDLGMELEVDSEYRAG